jgi:hypothetical protein
MTAPSPRQINDAGARITFRTVDDGEPHNVLPALARWLIDIEQRRKARQVQQQAEQLDVAGDDQQDHNHPHQ